MKSYESYDISSKIKASIPIDMETRTEHKVPKTYTATTNLANFSSSQIHRNWYWNWTGFSKQININQLWTAKACNTNNIHDVLRCSIIVSTGIIDKLKRQNTLFLQKAQNHVFKF